MPHAHIHVRKIFFILPISLQNNRTRYLVYVYQSTMYWTLWRIQRILRHCPWPLGNQVRNQLTLTLRFAIFQKWVNRRWFGMVSQEMAGFLIHGHTCLQWTDLPTTWTAIHSSMLSQLETHKYTKPWRRSFYFSCLSLSSFFFSVVSWALFLMKAQQVQLF